MRPRPVKPLFRRSGYPPVVLKKEDRKKYYDSLRKADTGDLSELSGLICRALIESLLLYLSALSEEHQLVPLKKLSRSTPYSQEYLSLRARQEKLEAAKIDGIWCSSKAALSDYAKGKRDPQQ